MLENATPSLRMFYILISIVILVDCLAIAVAGDDSCRAYEHGFY